MKQFEVVRKQIEYVSKALEIVLFLIMERSLGLEGSGFFLVSLMTFSMLWLFFGEYLPDALAKLIRVRRSKGQHNSVREIRFIAFFCQLFMGILGSLIMLALGTLLADKVYLCTYAELMIWILSPVIFLRGMTFLFLGFCQGEGYELPAVITCIARPIAIYGIGSAISIMTGNYGEKVSAVLKQERFTPMYTATGWSIAFVLAELLMLAIVIVSFIGTKRKNQNRDEDSLRASVSVQGYVGALFRNVKYKILIRFLEMFPIVIGMMIFFHKEKEKAPLTYGTYFVGYFAICLIAYYLMCAVIVPFWGRVYGHNKQGEKRLARITFHGGIHLVFVLAGAISVSIAMLPSQFGGLAGFTSPQLVKVVVPGSFWILFMSLAFYFSRMMMRMKKNLLCVCTAALCDILFLMLFLIFGKDEKMGILALVYACLISSAVYALMLAGLTISIIGGKVKWLQVLWIPAIGVAIMGGIQYICVKFLGMYIKDLFIVVGVGGLGIFFYLCGLLFAKNFDEEELSLIGSGKFLFGLGKMLGVF